MKLLLFIAGLCNIGLGIWGPLRRAGNPRDDRDRAAKPKLIGYAALCIGGGLAIVGYSLFA